jgi:Flp pilus assembly protein TadD
MDKRLKDAEEALLEAIKLEPHNADHYANLGLIYFKAGMMKRAQSQFEKALKLDPGNAKAQKGLKQTEG